MNLPTSVVITGMRQHGVLEQAFAAARSFRPLTEANGALLSKTAGAARNGRFEPFKTSSIFDSTAKTHVEVARRRARAADEAGACMTRVDGNSVVGR